MSAFGAELRIPMYRQADAMDIGKSMIILRIIWAAMLFSLAIYLLLGQYIIENETVTTFENFPIDTLRAVLYAISVVTIAGIRVLRRAVMPRKNEQNGSIQISSAPQHPVFAKYTTAMIISLALAESVGIYGLVLAFLGGRAFDLYLLVIASAAVMTHYRPKGEELTDLLKHTTRAS